MARPGHTGRLVEPPDRGIGCSSAGLSTRIHRLVGGNGVVLAVITPGKTGDCPKSLPLTGQLRVARDRGSGVAAAGCDTRRWGTRLERTAAASRGITGVIPEPDDEVGQAKAAGLPAASRSGWTTTTTRAGT